MFKSIGEKLSRKTGGAPPQTVELIRQTLTQVIDPDLHRDIVSLGFVKEIDVKGNGAKIVVELTTPACPAKDQMQKQIEELTLAIDGISEVDVVFTADTRARKTTLGADVLPALGRVKNIVAVASGKGGVGKSTTTVNLAYALAKAGSKVGILDADIYGPSIPLMTGVADPTETEGTMVVPPMVDGVKAISVAMFAQKGGAQLMRGPMTAQIIKQFLTQIAWGELDYLLIDYPPGTGDIQLTLSQMAPISGAVLVTTPQEVALVDVRKAIKMFSTTKVSARAINGSRHSNRIAILQPIFQLNNLAA